MVDAPSVVSKAKSSFSAIARSSSRRPSFHASPFASRWVSEGWAARIVRAASSGLKYCAPRLRIVAPPIELLPAPLTPARTKSRCVPLASLGRLAPLHRACGDRARARGARRFRRRPHGRRSQLRR
jgi:hypothetical protein